MIPMTAINRPARPDFPDPTEAAECAAALGIPVGEVRAVRPHERGRVAVTADGSQYLIATEGRVFWFGSKPAPKNCALPVFRDELEAAEHQQAQEGWSLRDLELAAGPHVASVPHPSMWTGWLDEDPQQTPVRAYILARFLADQRGMTLREGERYLPEVARFLGIIRASNLLDPAEAARL